MNIKLVDSLIDIIQSLDEEHRKLLEEKLFFDSSEATIKELIYLAQNGHSFDFLDDEPDLYSLEDGEPV